MKSSRETFSGELGIGKVDTSLSMCIVSMLLPKQTAWMLHTSRERTRYARGTEPAAGSRYHSWKQVHVAATWELH